LFICNSVGVGLFFAGVFGSKNSGVSDSTTTLFLESAYFDPGTIRRTSMHHNLRTDAAKVFEKGADPNLTVVALKRAAMLICELTGGVVSSEIIDEYPKEIKPIEIRLRYRKVNEIIGHVIEEDTVHNILNAMDMEISPMDADSIIVKVPTNKFDVTREIDLIEEILRIYGFNDIPIPTVIKSSINYSQQINKNEIKNQIGDLLAAKGFNEMMGMSLIESRQALDQIDVDESNLVYINNTSNIHLDILRPDVLISGALSILHNINRQQNDVKLFEFGKSYKSVEDGFEETEHLSIFIT
jgi:phenylalanyl-tRNA synthetase beta chain